MILHDKQDKWLINLMKLLNDMHAPDYIFQQVKCWAVSAKAHEFEFNGNRGFSHNSNLKWMFEMTKNAHLMLPMVHPIQQENGQIAEIVCYDFVLAALWLLQDRSIMNQTNLALDMSNPLAMYCPQDGRLGKARPCRGEACTVICTSGTSQIRQSNYSALSNLLV